MKPAAAMLTPLLDAGAALVLNGALSGLFMVLAQEHLLLNQELIYHVAFEDMSRGLSSIRFDSMTATDEHHIEIIRDGLRVATIQPVSEVGPDAQIAWRGWQQWCDAHYIEYYHEVTQRLRERDSEA